MVQRVRWMAVLAGVVGSATVSAADVGVASFNLGWAGTASDYARHVQVCSTPAVNWCNLRAKVAKGAIEPTPSEAARAKQCQSAFDQASGGAANGLAVAPCNAYKLSPKRASDGGPNLYLEKLQGLRQTIEELITQDRVDVLAFQEVRSKEVIEDILGPHAFAFDSCVATHTAFQTVGFAWRRTLSSTPGVCEAEAALSIKESPGDPASLRTLRPGIALRLNIGGQSVSFLNVHLKSSCANLVTGGGFPGRLLDDADAACRVLNRQVLPLEAWIERSAKQSPLLVLLGDFNRRLDQEMAANPAPNQVRADGSPASGVNRGSADGSVATRYLWQEISDGDPGFVQVPLASAVTGCKGFVGLDHILISEALRARQQELPTSVKRPVVKKPKQAIQTSDHCPRVTRLGV